MKPSIKRSLSLLVSAALLIGALVSYTNLLKPEYDAIQKLRGSLVARSDLFTNQKRIISQTQDLLAQYQGAAKLQETISLALPLGEAAASLFQQIFTISRGSGLQILSFGLSAGAIRPNGLGDLKLNLNLAGPYESLKSFTQSLETNIRVMDVSQVKIQKDSYNLSVNTYYQQ